MQGKGHSAEELNKLINSYESALNEGNSLYLSVDEYEMIIDYYVEQTRDEKAHNAVDLGIETYPFESILFYRKALLCFGDNQHIESLLYIDKALVLDPTNSEYIFFKGEQLEQRGHVMDAISVYKKSLEYAEERNHIYIRLATCYEQMGNGKISKEYLDRIDVEEISDELTFITQFAELEMFDYAKILVRFAKKYIDTDSYSSIAWFNLGTAYEDNDEFDRAVWAYDYAGLIDEEYVDTVMFRKSKCFMSMESYDKAEEILLELIKKDDHSPNFNNALAQCYFETDRIASARNFFKRSVKNDPTNFDGWYGIGLTFLAESQPRIAISIFEKALAFEDSIACILDIAVAYLMIEDWKKAEQYFTKAVDKEPTVQEAWLGLAEALKQDDRLVDSLEILEQAASTLKENHKIIYRKSAYLFLLGKTQEACEELNRALNTNPDEYDLLFEDAPFLRKSEVVHSIIDLYRK
jgi:tetratricopeptide (TPR) repeat protein